MVVSQLLPGPHEERVSPVFSIIYKKDAFIGFISEWDTAKK